MNIIDNRDNSETINFSEVKLGECFQHENNTYMKISYSTNESLCVNIKTGQAKFLAKETIVMPLSADVIIN